MDQSLKEIDEDKNHNKKHPHKADVRVISLARVFLCVAFILFGCRDGLFLL